MLINKDTDRVNLTGYVCVYDCETVINPMVVDGQIHGGLVQGIRAALWEAAVFDEGGQLVSGSFMDYAMPLAHQLPALTLDRTVAPSPHNPLGAKGIGESTAVAAVPAVVNAVVDALAHFGGDQLGYTTKAGEGMACYSGSGVCQNWLNATYT